MGQGEIRKHSEMNKNETQHAKIYKIRVKVVLRGKCIAVNTYIKKERSQIKNLTYHIRKLKQGQ